MRITNALQTRDIIQQLATNSAKLAEAQNRVSTGVKVQRMSDDPTAASAIMQASSSLRAIDRFQRNVGQVGSQLDVEDTSLDQITQLMTRAKELAVGQAGATASTQSRAAAAVEVKQLIAQVVTIGNTKMGDDYIFGGANSPDRPPFDQQQSATSPVYVSIPSGQTTPLVPQGMRQVEIAAGQTMTGVHDGDTLLVSSGVLQSLQDLYTGLSTDSTAAISASMPGIDSAFSQVQMLVGDIGARRNQVDSVSASLDAFQANLSTLKSGLAEVDMEQAISEMMSRQTAYQAAMLASSKVMGMSLTDYLR